MFIKKNAPDVEPEAFALHVMRCWCSGRFDRLNRAFASTCATVNAGVCIDYKSRVAFADGFHGAYVFAASALGAAIGDNISHDFVSFHVHTSFDHMVVQKLTYRTLFFNRLRFKSIRKSYACARFFKKENRRKAAAPVLYIKSQY